MSQQPNGATQSSNGAVGDSGLPPLDDPRSLLRVYPVATYTPTARVAGYFSPFTEVHREPIEPSALYPAYEAQYQRIQLPQNENDRRARAEAEHRLKQLMQAGQQQGITRRTLPYPSPTDSTNGHAAEPAEGPLPLPYAFLSPSTHPYAPRAPPTPSSDGTPERKLSPEEYLEKHVQDILARPDPNATATNGNAKPTVAAGTSQSKAAPVTPSIARTLASTSLAETGDESPDPLAQSGPSPSKRAKHANGHASPSRAGSSSGRKIKLNVGRAGSSSSATHTEPKRKLIPEVVIPIQARPAKHAAVQKETRQSDGEEEENIDWGDGSGQDADGDWHMDESSFRSPSPTRAAMPTGSGRTGERDQRSTFQKLHTLFEDILEECDALAADVTLEDLRNSRYFYSIANIGSTPLLSSRAISKLVEYASRVRGKKRRESETWDLDALVKVLRMLEKSMREGSDLASVDEVSKVEPSAKSKKGKKSSKSPELPEDGVKAEGSAITAEKAIKYEQDLERLAAVGAAASCALALLDQHGLPKQMYSEGILGLAVSIIKTQTNRVIFPVIACIGGEKPLSPLVGHLAAREQAVNGKKTNTPSGFVNPDIERMCGSTLSALPRIASLVTRADISFTDSLVIMTVYLAISPLFVAEPGSTARKKGKSAAGLAGRFSSIMKTLRMEAMSCLRVTFARNGGQRQWIIEEIMAAMVKVPDQTGPRMRFQLPGGDSIHTISALLLQLLQASATGVIARVKKLRASIIDAEVLGTHGADKLDLAEEEAKLCTAAIDAVTQSARTVATYLFQRSSTSQANKTSQDTDYKAILDTLVADLQVVLYRPEWPAACIFLDVISRLMMNALDERRTGPDASAGKNVALDHLGDIAARISTMVARMNKQSVPTLDEIVASTDLEGLKRFCEAQAQVDSHLLASAAQDDMYSSARDLGGAIRGRELQVATTKMQSILDKSAEAGDAGEDDMRDAMHALCQALKSASKGIWQNDTDLFEAKDPRQSEVAVQASIALARSQPLRWAFGPILMAVGSSMNSTVVAIRSKALRAMTSIITADPDVLGMAFVKTHLENRLADSSPAVRDAAVDLLGKYIVQKPNLAIEYYPLISARITDPGIGVRKRVIKILIGIFDTSGDATIRADICCRLFEVMEDHDDNVKALATKTLAEMLFPAGSTSSDIQLLHDVVAEYDGPSKTLEQAIQTLLPEVAGGLARFGPTVEALVTRLIEATAQADFDSFAHIKAISLLCVGDATLVDTNKASVLLSYLRPAVNADDQANNDAILKIFRRCIPAMPRVTSSFATDLVATLSPMVTKPTGGLGGLTEIVACLSVAVSHLTRDYAPLYKVLRACEARLRAARTAYAQNPPQLAATTPIALMLYITALIVAHCDLDKVAEDDDMVQREIRSITELRLPEYFFDMYLEFSQYSIYQNTPTLALGSLFHAYPILIVRDEATDWMKRVFASTDHESQARLLGAIHDFLRSEADKKAAGKSEQDIKALIGNKEELGESGASAIVVQRNMDSILQGARSLYPPLQHSALDVLTFIVKQGLSHPLEPLPILISLETSEEEAISERALSLHEHLHTKHPSLVTIRFLEFAKSSYDYQRSITAEPSGQRHGEALLQPWYTLISEKKAWRIEFLRASVRAFDYDLAKKDIPDIGFVLYLAENLATFNYKLQDEPMSVVQFLGNVINSSTHLASMLESGQVEGGPADNIEGKRLVISGSDEVVLAEVAINASLIVCLALTVKNHLLSSWGLSEDKCLKHTPGKKSSAGDKPAQRKHTLSLDLARLPLIRGVVTCDDFRTQAATFLQMLSEDGSLSPYH